MRASTERIPGGHRRLLLRSVCVLVALGVDHAQFDYLIRVVVQCASIIVQPQNSGRTTADIQGAWGAKLDSCAWGRPGLQVVSLLVEVTDGVYALQDWLLASA